MNSQIKALEAGANKDTADAKNKEQDTLKKEQETLKLGEEITEVKERVKNIVGERGLYVELFLCSREYFKLYSFL